MAERAYGVGTSSLDDFQHIKLLGEGAFAAVFKVVRHADGKTYALKKVKLPSLSDKEKSNALNEIRLLASVRQENIVSYKDAFFDDKTRCLCIVTECCDGGDLMEQVTKCQKDRSHMVESDIWRWMIGLTRALKALHEMSIFHRDMKSANVFLNSTPSGRIAKLGDFNVSTVAKKGLCMTQTGTPYYASPEIWRDMPYDGKSDMWGLGCVVYEAAALRPPFRAEDMEGLAHKVCVGKYHRIPSVFSNELSDVIGLLLRVNPRHRPTPAQFLGLPLMSKHAMVLNLAEDEPTESNLLSTIKVPRKLLDMALPAPKYDLVDDHEFSQVDACPGDNFIGWNPEARKQCDSSRVRSKTTTPPKPLDPYRGGRSQVPDRQRRAGSRRIVRSRSDAALPRKRRENEAEQARPAQAEQEDCARECSHDTGGPEGPANLLPRIQLNRFAPAKILPKGLRLKLPRIASCPGVLV